MVARDGDGWIECSCGSKHWGLNGAAGILIYRDGAILLQHRAPWVHNGDTWGIPGWKPGCLDDVGRAGPGSLCSPMGIFRIGGSRAQAPILSSPQKR